MSACDKEGTTAPHRACSDVVANSSNKVLTSAVLEEFELALSTSYRAEEKHKAHPSPHDHIKGKSGCISAYGIKIRRLGNAMRSVVS